MKVLPFTIPVPLNRTIIVQEEILPHFYPHLHRHAEIQITWIQQGEGTLLAGNSMHAFSSGDVYVLGANLPHLFKSNPEYFNSDSQKEVRSLTVFFDPVGSLLALFDLPEMKTLQAFLAQRQSGFKIPDKYLSGVAGYMQKIKQATNAQQLALLIDMLDMMSAMEDVQPLSTDGYTHSLTDPEGERIALVYNYIMHNYNKALTLDAVARQAHLTPNAFCRYFKKHTRLTFVEFVNKVRVNAACKQLVNGSLNSMADVAYSCGFSSITNFNYVFKKVAGKSPREYISNYNSAVKAAP